jgi:hypothetical protein
LSITLKAHVMEQHVVACNNTYGLGDKEESFIVQGHQVGLKENRRYQGITNSPKKAEASLKARMIAMHPLIVEHNIEVLQKTKRKPPEKGIKDEVVTKKIKNEKIKEEKQQKQAKREYYVSKFTSEEKKY